MIEKKRIKFWYLVASLCAIDAVFEAHHLHIPSHHLPYIPPHLSLTPSKHVSIWYTHEYQKENKMEKRRKFPSFLFSADADRQLKTKGNTREDRS